MLGLPAALLLGALAYWLLAPRTASLPLTPQVRAQYPWRLAASRYRPLSLAFPAPGGFARVPVAPGSFGAWLRELPLRPPRTTVVTHKGLPIIPWVYPLLGAVVDLDVRQDQQCADVIYRLRAEYLWAQGHREAIRFAATDGSVIAWRDWQRGVRPRLSGQKLAYAVRARPDTSRKSFDAYLACVMSWCGTLSLAEDSIAVKPADLRPGDFFVRGGSPGHAVLLADVAQDARGQRQALIIQGLMPAMSAHVVSPPGHGGWVKLDPAHDVEVPLYGTFQWSKLRRFHQPEKAGVGVR